MDAGDDILGDIASRLFVVLIDIGRIISRLKGIVFLIEGKSLGFEVEITKQFRIIFTRREFLACVFLCCLIIGIGVLQRFQVDLQNDVFTLF